jgi:hypothetical protein
VLAPSLKSRRWYCALYLGCCVSLFFFHRVLVRALENRCSYVGSDSSSALCSARPWAQCPRPFSYSKQAVSASSCSPLPCSSFFPSFFSQCRLNLAEQQRPCVLRFQTSLTVAFPTPALSCRTCSLERRSPLAPSSCKFSDLNRAKFWCPASFLSLCYCVLYDPILSLFSHCVFVDSLYVGVSCSNQCIASL